MELSPEQWSKKNRGVQIYLAVVLLALLSLFIFKGFDFVSSYGRWPFVLAIIPILPAIFLRWGEMPSRNKRFFFWQIAFTFVLYVGAIMAYLIYMNSF
ncbi:MAG: hypothetical protein O2794_04005 [bacterium]|nr:hypothetical protein [bacterium]